MTYLLNIDTAAGEASICVSDGATPLSLLSNPVQMDHAAWIHTAVREALKNAGIQMSQLEAIAVTAGPGSYTGLRVGMATAKGLCYALNLPLITVSTLEGMAAAAIRALPVTDPQQQAPLICPMIDARRMEVFTAVYDTSLHTLLEPCAMILDEQSFSGFLEVAPVIFSGSGSGKWAKLTTHPNALFKNIVFSAADLAAEACKKLKTRSFSPLAYSDPIYIKEFYTPPTHNS